MIGRRRRNPEAGGRRSGPIDEHPWWDPTDQRAVEAVTVRPATFGRGWVDIVMTANAERLDPFEGVLEADGVRQARAHRGLTALDEGRTWRQRSVGSLAVLRLERFASADEVEHRQAWRGSATACLEAVWRARWIERDRPPGWIEARPWHPEEESVGVRREPVTVADWCDWYRIEDHTDPGGTQAVTCYEHLTIWSGRSHAVLVVRHDLGVDVHEVAHRVGEAVQVALAG